MKLEFTKCLLCNAKSKRIRKNSNDKTSAFIFDENDDLNNEETSLNEIFWHHSKAYLCPKCGIFYVTSLPKYLQLIVFFCFRQIFEHEKLSYVV